MRSLLPCYGRPVTQLSAWSRYYTLAWNYFLQKQYEQAQTRYEQALDTYLQILGPAHSDTLDIIDALRNCYRVQGKYPELNSLNQRIIELLEQNSEQKTGSLDIRVADIYFRQAKRYSKSEQYNAAEPFFKRALMIYLQAFGSKHPYTTEALCHLEVLDETGISGQKRLEEYLQEMGAKYRQITEVLFYLAKNYGSKQEHKIAIWYYFRVALILEYKLSEEKKGQNESRMLKDTFKDLGHNYLKIGNKEEAKYFFEQANNIIDH